MCEIDEKDCADDQQFWIGLKQERYFQTRARVQTTVDLDLFRQVGMYDGADGRSRLLRRIKGVFHGNLEYA